MQDLYKINVSEELHDIADAVAEECGVSKKLAYEAVKNTLIYNVVIEEIKRQAAFLLGIEND